MCMQQPKAARLPRRPQISTPTMPASHAHCAQELIDKETLTGQQIQELLTRVKGGKGSSAAPAS